MGTEEDSLDLDPTYVAGLLDAVGRVRFDIRETDDEQYMVRPMVRLRPYQTGLRAAVLGEFLEERDYQYDFVQRSYGEEFFRLQRRSDLEDLQSFLRGKSANLVRELAFVNETFADEFDHRLLDPRDLYRFTLARDQLRYGWRPRGRYHLVPEDLVERHDLDLEGVTVPSISAGYLRSDYAVEWLTGVYDGRCRYRPSISQSSEYHIDHAMYPIARIRHAGVSSQYVSHFTRFCDDYNLPHGDSSEPNTLNIIFTGASNIRRILDVIFPRLLVLAEASEVLANSVLPRFDEEIHHEKQGFYDLLRDFDQVAEASGGPFRRRDYDPAYFADLWRDELDLVDEEEQMIVSRFDRESLEDLDEVMLSPSEFQNSLGRYQSLVDRVQRDRQKVAELKSLYNDCCQLCGARLASSDGTGYSEVHHVRPLGTPHNGPDKYGNMLVLCPNHHADFDNGVLRVDPDDLSLEHPYDSAVDGEQLSVNPEHELSKEVLQYHDQRLCRLR